MSELVGWVFDGLLALSLVLLAARVVASARLFESIVLFIVFGLLMAIAWARLAAPHLALAEAAIGAGITGALLLSTFREIVTDQPPSAEAPKVLVYRLRVLMALLAGGVFAVLGWALLSIEVPAGPAAGEQARALVARTGVDDAVTAVLLDFRAYDTLLEMGVLLLAVLGARAAVAAQPPASGDDLWSGGEGDTPMVGALVGLLSPLIIIVAGYLLWVGAYGPGGAFQAGAVLAALGVLLRLTGRLVPLPRAGAFQRGVLVMGLAVFSLAGLLTMATGRAFLQYPEGLAYPMILVIEVALTLSIALPLVLLFSGSAGIAAGRSQHSP